MMQVISSNLGWSCPKCGKCWSPIVQGCLGCNVETTVATPYNPWPYDIHWTIPPQPSYGTKWTVTCTGTGSTDAPKTK